MRKPAESWHDGGMTHGTQVLYTLDDDRPFLARYEYDRGERESWNGLTGVGHPGEPASLMITEVNFGQQWQDVDLFPDIDWSIYEQQIMDKIIERESAEADACAEAEAEYYADNRRVEE